MKKTLAPQTTTIILSAILLLAACGQPKPEVKATTKAAPVMATKIKVDKSTPKIMYINTNNVHIYDLNQSQMQAGVTTNTPSLEQFMKYDKVTLYDTREDWVYVEGSARDTKTSVVRPVGGWVAKDTVTEWIPEKFFAVQDNVFKKIEQPITVYNDSLEGQAVDTIAKGDTLRVLKGNGERFFVVSQKGKEGWIEAESVDTSQLVAKGFGFKDKLEKSLSPSSIVKDNDGKPMVYRLQPEDLNNPHVLTGDFDKVPLFFESYKDEKYIKQYGRETNVAQALGYENEENTRTEVVDGKVYTFRSYLIMNFYGMIAKIDLGFPKEYEVAMVDFYKNKLKYRIINGVNTVHYYSLNMNQFEQLMKWMKKKGPFEEIVRIQLYTRDVRLNKIKDFEIKGTFSFQDSFKYSNLKNKNNIIRVEENGDITLVIGILENGILLDNYSALKDDVLIGKLKNISGVMPYQYDIEINAKNEQIAEELIEAIPFVLKPKPYRMKISKSELQNAGVDAIVLQRVWSHTLKSQRRITPKKYSELKNKVLSYMKHDLNLNSVKEKIDTYLTLRYVDHNNIYLFSCTYVGGNSIKTTIYYFLNQNGTRIHSKMFKDGAGSYLIKTIKNNLVILLIYKDQLYPILFKGINYAY